MQQRDMEEDIRKKGMLYLHQQRFGKKWRKVWSILYRESICSISRLEFFECKDGGSGTLEKSKCKQDTKKIIRLSDCIRVSDAADVDGCPRDCRAFLVETTEKTFIFAVEMVEVEDWMQKLCEIAFPMNWSERGAVKRSSVPQDPEDVSMTDNSLYSGKESALRDFRVVIRRTDAAERCGLKGQYLLRTDFDSLLLKEPKTGEVHFTWPYRYLRRFGRDKTTFSFEAGRRCDSGEGNFEFDTKQGNSIFHYVEGAIHLQKVGYSQQQPAGGIREPLPPHQPPKILPPAEDSGVYSMLNEAAVKDKPKQSSPLRTRLETPTDKHLTGVKSLNIDARPIPRKNQVKNFRSCPLANTEEEAYSRVTAPHPDKEIPDRAEQDQEQHPTLRSCSSTPDSDYSLPFDSIAKNVMRDFLSSTHLPPPPMVVEPSLSGQSRGGSEKGAEPLYDSIDESAITSFNSKPKRHPSKYSPLEHIYDEPEGCATAPRPATALYDDPKEVRNNAWKTLGTASDPSGHEFPYNAHADDYAVPKPPRRARIPEQEKERGEKIRMAGKQKEAEGDEDDSPYDNVMLKMKDSSLNE